MAAQVLEETLRYAKDRKAFGQPIGSLQWNKFLLADLVTRIEVTQAYVDNCVAAHAAGELTAIDAAKAKWWGSESRGPDSLRAATSSPDGQSSPPRSWYASCVPQL